MSSKIRLHFGNYFFRSHSHHTETIALDIETFVPTISFALVLDVETCTYLQLFFGAISYVIGVPGASSHQGR